MSDELERLTALVSRLCCDTPDCAERILCPTVGGVGHFQCGWCEEHDAPRHVHGCVVTEATS